MATSNTRQKESKTTLANGDRHATPMTAKKQANQKGNRTDCKKRRGVSMGKLAAGQTNSKGSRNYERLYK
jgi:hypothetical protein